VKNIKKPIRATSDLHQLFGCTENSLFLCECNKTNKIYGNFELIIKILLNNGYPFIFSEIKNRLSKRFKQWNNQGNTNKTNKTTIMKIKLIIKFLQYSLYYFYQKRSKNFFKKIPYTWHTHGI